MGLEPVRRHCGGARIRLAPRVAITVDRQQGSTKVNFKGSCRARPLLPSSHSQMWLAPMDVRRDYPPGSPPSCPLNTRDGVLRRRNRHLPEEKSLERTICPMVVSMLQYAVGRRYSRCDVSENQSCCCWIGSSPETVVFPSLVVATGPCSMPCLRA